MRKLSQLPEENIENKSALDEGLDEVQQMFLHEGKKYLHQIETQFHILEDNLHDKASIQEIFRLMHSFKGMAGIASFTEFETYFHHYETLIEMIQEDRLTVDNQLLDFFYESLDVIDHVIRFIENREPYAPYVEKFTKIIQTKSSLIVIPKEEVEKRREKIKHVFEKYGLKEFRVENLESREKQPLFQIMITLSQDTPLKVARVMIIAKILQKLGRILMSIPEPLKIFTGDFESAFTLFFQICNCLGH